MVLVVLNKYTFLFVSHPVLFVYCLQVLPGVQLIIGLCHSGGTGKKSSTPHSRPQQSPDHDHVLEHSLHQLLREVHHKNTHHPFPHPSSGPLGPSKRRCLAGPNAADRYQLLEMTKR